MRRVLQPLWVLLALVFLLEAWLWDHLEPVVARIVAWIPLHKFKHWLAERISHLSPPLTLVVFLVPAVLLFPLKLLGVWLLAHQIWLGAAAVIVFGKLVGVGVAAFIFDVTKPKLMQMAWFHRVYGWVIDARAWALNLVAPIMRRLRRSMRMLRTRGAPRWLRVIQRTRRRMLAAR